MSEVDGTTDNRFVYSPHFSTRLKKCKMVSVFTSGYVNTETILHFFYKITNERGMKTMFTYTHVKWFYGQSERTYYLNYFIKHIENMKSYIKTTSGSVGIGSI